MSCYKSENFTIASPLQRQYILKISYYFDVPESRPDFEEGVALNDRKYKLINNLIKWKETLLNLLSKMCNDEIM